MFRFWSFEYIYFMNIISIAALQNLLFEKQNILKKTTEELSELQEYKVFSMNHNNVLQGSTISIIYYKLSGNKGKQFQVLFCMQMQKWDNYLKSFDRFKTTYVQYGILWFKHFLLQYCIWFEKRWFEKDTMIIQQPIILSYDYVCRWTFYKKNMVFNQGKFSEF